MKTKDLALATLSAFMHFIFEHIQKIWLDQCAYQISFEKSNNIRSNTKKDNTSATGYEKTQQIQVLTIHDAIDKMVRLRSHWTNFWCCSGQALFHLCDYWKIIVLAQVRIRFWESAGSVLIQFLDRDFCIFLNLYIFSYCNYIL